LLGNIATLSQQMSFSAALWCRSLAWVTNDARLTEPTGGPRSGTLLKPVIVKLLGHVLWDMERAIRMDVTGTCPGGATKVVAGARNFRELTLNCPI
jgi:hypothetical protein